MSRYIDAEALLKQWEKEEKVLGLAFGIALIAAMNEVKKFPTADVAPVVRGEWIGHVGYYECPICHKLAVTEYNFCPFCGAKMV